MYRFFQDATSHHDNVIAVFCKDDGALTREGLAATFAKPNSGVSWTGVSKRALGAELSEEEARALHPRLFQRLDNSHAPA